MPLQELVQCPNCDTSFELNCPALTLDINRRVFLGHLVHKHQETIVIDNGRRGPSVPPCDTPDLVVISFGTLDDLDDIFKGSWLQGLERVARLVRGPIAPRATRIE